MKKFLLAGLLAVPLAALPQQQASAWCKFNFGVGANIGYQSGGSKSLLWGLYQSSDFNAVNPATMTGGYAAAQLPGAVGGPPAFGGAPAFGGYGGAPAFGGYGAPAFSGPGTVPAPQPPIEMGPTPMEKEPPRAKPAQYQQPAVQADPNAASAGYAGESPESGYSPNTSAQVPSYWYGN